MEDCDPTVIHVAFAVDKLVLRQVSVQLLGFPVNYHSTNSAAILIVLITDSISYNIKNVQGN